MKLLHVSILKIANYTKIYILKENKRIVWRNCFRLPEFSFHDLFVQAEEVKHRKKKT